MADLPTEFLLATPLADGCSAVRQDHVEHVRASPVTCARQWPRLILVPYSPGRLAVVRVQRGTRARPQAGTCGLAPSPSVHWQRVTEDVHHQAGVQVHED